MQGTALNSLSFTYPRQGNFYDPGVIFPTKVLFPELCHLC